MSNDMNRMVLIEEGPGLIIRELAGPGPIGPTGPAGVTWRGVWDGATAYGIGDGVSHGGSSYLAVAGHTNHEPPDAPYWGVLATAAVESFATRVRWEGV
jgi:hypothetical protein